MRLLFLLALLLLLLAAATTAAQADERKLVIEDEELTMDELKQLGKNPLFFSSNEVKREDAERAVKKLEEEEQKIKSTLQEDRVRRAQEQWERLTPEQKRHVTELAHKQADERRRAMEESLRVLEKQDVEAQLHAELDEQAEREEARERELHHQRGEEAEREFQAKRDRFRVQQQERRTPAASLVFWASVVGGGALFTRMLARG